MNEIEVLLSILLFRRDRIAAELNIEAGAWRGRVAQLHTDVECESPVPGKIDGRVRGKRGKACYRVQGTRLGTAVQLEPHEQRERALIARLSFHVAARGLLGILAGVGVER